jgi:hypothetical protein
MHPVVAEYRDYQSRSDDPKIDAARPDGRVTVPA